MAIHVTVWNEYLHEKQFPEIASIYPKGIHGCIADFLQKAGMTVQTATLEEPEHGLTQDVLDNTDVLIWWGHMAHHKVADEIVERVYRRVLDGMGLIVLHSGHASKIFQKVCGTNSGRLKWREDGEQEILWVIDPSHPIVAGLDEKIMIPHRCTANTSISRNRTSRYSSAGSRAARCSAAAAAGTAARVRCSTSARVMRRSQSIISRRSSRSS